MFNQKVNGYWSQNPSYLNYSLGAPGIKALDIHNCGTTINKYRKEEPCGALPLQTWCSKNIAVESFAMRPIVNSKEYFEIIKKFLSSIIYADSIPLKASNLSSHSYNLLADFGYEPQSSFLQAIQLEVTDKLMYLFGESTSQIPLFNEYNPICEGFILTDIDITTYQCNVNINHFFHKVLFSAVNTTRYNTISFKADIYQDTTPMMESWNNNIRQVQNSQDVSKDTSAKSLVYIAMIDLMNNTTCVLGQESDCEFTGYNLKSHFSQLLNDKLLAQPNPVSWLQPDSLSNNNYTVQGNYDQEGKIRIIDNGPSDIDQLIQNYQR